MSQTTNYLSVEDAQNLTRQFSAQIQKNQELEHKLHSARDTQSGLYAENTRLRNKLANQEEALSFQRNELEAARFDRDATRSILRKREHEAVQKMEKTTSRFSLKNVSLKNVAFGALIGAPYVAIGVWALINHTNLFG